jgi:hypothetical protein
MVMRKGFESLSTSFYESRMTVNLLRLQKAGMIMLMLPQNEQSWKRKVKNPESGR